MIHVGLEQRILEAVAEPTGLALLLQDGPAVRLREFVQVPRERGDVVEPTHDGAEGPPHVCGGEEPEVVARAERAREQHLGIQGRSRAEGRPVVAVHDALLGVRDRVPHRGVDVVQRDVRPRLVERGPPRELGEQMRVVRQVPARAA
jgi:hypothetical protein